MDATDVADIGLDKILQKMKIEVSNHGTTTSSGGPVIIGQLGKMIGFEKNIIESAVRQDKEKI